MAAADPEQAAANKAAEKAAKAAARRAKAAAKGKGNKAAESGPSGNSNVWGPFEAPSDEEMDPEALVKSKVRYKTFSVNIFCHNTATQMISSQQPLLPFQLRRWLLPGIVPCA